jgi:hypothetical protein
MQVSNSERGTSYRFKGRNGHQIDVFVSREEHPNVSVWDQPPTRAPATRTTLNKVGLPIGSKFTEEDFVLRPW